MRRSSGSSSEPNGTTRPGPRLFAVAGDDPLRAIGLLVVDGDAKLVDGEWKGRPRHVGRHDRLDAVRFEKPPDDVGFDLRRRPEDDGQPGHERRITHVTPRSAWPLRRRDRL